MHTLKPTNSSADLYDVWFVGSEAWSPFVVTGAVSKGEALKLVNYLNGGAGNNLPCDPVQVCEVGY